MERLEYYRTKFMREISCDYNGKAKCNNQFLITSAHQFLLNEPLLVPRLILTSIFRLLSMLNLQPDSLMFLSNLKKELETIAKKEEYSTNFIINMMRNKMLEMNKIRDKRLLPKKLVVI